MKNIENELLNCWNFITNCICTYYFDRNIIPTVETIINHFEYQYNKIELPKNEIQLIIDRLYQIYY